LATFERKNIRLGQNRYVGQAPYFVTMCSLERRTIFADGAHATRLIEIVRKHSDTYQFAVHAYCVMPDHLHLLAVGLKTTSNLPAFLKNVKQTSSAEFQKNSHHVLWQKKFYDRILRRTDNLDGIAGYIWMNPVRAGLCTDPRGYPFSSSFVADWKKIVRPLESWVPEWKKKQDAPK
jgi:REP element-mobilizing transposase RayT